LREIWLVRLKIDGSKGYLDFVDFRILLAKGEKAIEFMIPTPRVPTVGTN
jgi:hypothetical protein